MHEAGISTYAFVGPILPHFLVDHQILKRLLDKLQEVGVTEVWFEHINLSSKIRNRLYDYLRKDSPELIEVFDHANTQKYRNQLDDFIVAEMKSRGLKLGLGKVIHHRSLPKKDLIKLA